MFEINFLNKKGSQFKEKKTIKLVKDSSISQNNNKSNSNNNKFNIKYFYSLFLILVLSLFFYIFLNSSNNYKENYEDIAPGNILTLLENHTKNNKIFSIETNSNSFQIIKEISEFSDIYFEQAFFDSLFDISSYISVNRKDRKLYLDFNWYKDNLNNIWDIRKLYEALNSESVLTARVELFQNNVILVANYTELINLFNILKRLQVEHSFKYQVELFKKGVRSKNNYYKILISNND